MKIKVEVTKEQVKDLNVGQTFEIQAVSRGTDGSKCYVIVEMDMNKFFGEPDYKRDDKVENENRII